MKIQGAAISLQGVNFAIVVVDMDLVNSSAEADMAIERISPGFGDVPVVLMAQKEDGSPVYYGDEDLVRSLADVPIDKMPWKEYSVAV
ncbi:MAG: hypothetical protein HKN34_10335 [Gammaproteobacteria bacterium]|nr:hypothetical protein [Gammaproteobacteria bacterium]